MARDSLQENPHIDLKLRLIANRQKDGRTYNLPTTSEVATLLIGDVSDSLQPRDILVTTMATKLRSSTYENLMNLRDQGTSSVSKVGRTVILPSSFTGGARYMTQNYLDAMTLCKWFGYLDFFITVTCNPKWPEMTRFLKDTTLNSEDRPDILCRLFKIKLDALLKDLKDKAVLGKVQAVVYTIEFQKRGLPHAHMCLFMHADHKLPDVEHVDPFISAEIPDKNEDPELHYLVSELMIHGPCGAHNRTCSCMFDNKCSKNFPKNFRDATSVDSQGYPQYRRRDSGQFVQKEDIQLDNRSVVPYNKYLLKRYQAHINVEWCNQASSIKYLFKYINKGPDRATVFFFSKNETQANVEQPEVDEIKQFYDCLYLSASKAAWRIFGYDVHYRMPSVTRLPFHLPGQQHVVYGVDDDLDNVLEKVESVSSSMFTGWMKCNEKYASVRKLTYVELPTEFVWHAQPRRWERRKSGFSIGRIHVVSPAAREAYFLRILLNRVIGPQSFEDIRTVNGRLQPSFRDACYSLGLLEDDQEYIKAIEEASHSSLGHGTLSTAIRSKGEIVLTVASSGIASLLLTGGRTAHSRFHIPINLSEDSTCYMDPGTDESQLLEKSKLIIWDEAPMHHKHGFQALDRSLKDVLSSNLLFGGKVVVFGGDFRQILPVVQKGTRQDIVNASLCSSYIWSECNVLKLTKNLRLTMGTPSSDVEETRLFAKWILDIGEGTIGVPNDGVATVDIPDDLLIKYSVDPISKLFDFVYPDILQNYKNQHYFQDRAILAATNEIVDEINDSLHKFFPGDEVEYLSSDTICSSEYINDTVDTALYSLELLNGLRISGLPNHKLVLKVGVPVMLLRNLNQQEGLCNGTRLQIISLGTRVVEAKIISGTNIGHRVLIHRSPLTPSDNKIAYKFQRRQFPLAVCFVMTINKSQGQSLSRSFITKGPLTIKGVDFSTLKRTFSWANNTNREVVACVLRLSNTRR
ncbi:uncharacterized protein LOC143588627 [Bidens hawaiensis]|uniref:uncharacterized protein LOC143588627 n=1 Tax=Bidens hawaiensis TaxID=980011 RepID=UPI00404A171F